MGFTLGIDIGGTFTDCVVIAPDGAVHIGKALSTPPDFHDGFIASIEATAAEMGTTAQALLADADGVYHGCTVGTNALVEGRTATVGLLTSRGHGDSIFAMQSGRRLRTLPAEEIAHVAGHTKPAPIVPRALVRELHERVAHDGAVLAPLDEASTRTAIEQLRDAGVEAFAVSLLWSVANDAHERRVAELVGEIAPDAYLSVASEVILRTGEYERTVATVVNALVGPEMDRYLETLEERCQALGYGGNVHVMTCSGGVISALEARRLPVLTIGSGPVAGLIGAQRLALAEAASTNGAETAREPGNVITADMGGTTLDVGVVHRARPLSRATSWYQQYEYYVPTLDVRSVGAGGGSIIRFDEAMGTLRVGPQSAGADPGPACYGRGGAEATVTDADLVAGLLNPDYFLGGRMQLDLDAARAALERAGAPLGFGAEQTAAAALRIVDNEMADAIRLASVQQGLDPRAFAMHAYGGAGPLHGAAIARELGIERIVVPLSDLAAGWSAFGIAGSDALVVQEIAQPMRQPFDVSLLNELWAQLEARVLERMAAQGLRREQLELVRSIDMRYPLQVNEVEVDAPDGEYDDGTIADVIALFEREYERLYGEGTGSPEAGFAITGLRLRARAPRTLPLPERSAGETREAVPRGHRDVIFYEVGPERHRTPIYGEEAVRPGVTLAGPAIIELPDTSIVVRHGGAARVDAQGSVIVTQPPATAAEED